MTARCREQAAARTASRSVVAAGSELEDRRARGGVRHEDRQQAVAGLRHEVGGVAGEVDDRLPRRYGLVEHPGFHSRLLLHSRVGRAPARHPTLADGSMEPSRTRSAATKVEDAVTPPEGRSNRYSVITDGLPSQLPDIDPAETREWIESLDAVVDAEGRGRARFLLLKLLERAREQSIGVPALRSTDYINTIPPEREPWFPGRRARRAPDPRIRPLERRDHGQPGQPRGPRSRRPHRHVRQRRQPLRGRLQPLLPRQGSRRERRPGLLPGPRLPRHLRPRLSSRAGSPSSSSTASARRSAPTGCRPTRTRG